MDRLYRYWGLAIYAIVLLLVLFLPAKSAEDWVLQFTACKAQECHEHTITPPEGATMMDCVKQGQFVALQWLHDNKPPGWAIKKYRCGPRQGAA